MPFATPAAADGVGSHGGGQGRSLRTDIHNWKNSGRRQWRTPLANELSGGPTNVEKRLANRQSIRLQDQVAEAEKRPEQWRTPTANDAEKSGESLGQLAARGQAASYPLSTQVNEPELWPTPTADAPGWILDGKVELVDKNGDPPAKFNQRFYNAETGQLVQRGLDQAVAFFPTPTKQDGVAGMDAAGRQGGPSLRARIARDIASGRRLLPSPKTSDAKGTGPEGSPSQLSDLKKSNLRAYGPGGQLNPDWVEWLMGWPIGWTSLEPLDPDEVELWYRMTTAGVWWDEEPDIPRVASDVADRRQRIEALGNGQVALQAAVAYSLLSAMPEEFRP